MKTILCSIPLLVLLLALRVGDEGWLLFVTGVAGLVAYRTDFAVVRGLAVAAGLGIVVAHGAGYKLYGRAIELDNLPVLHAPQEVASFAMPNVVITKDGSRHELRGVQFTPFLPERPFEELRGMLLRTGKSIPLLIEPDPASPSGFVVQSRREYFCGNTFFPTFTPRRLPMYARDDLGELLSYGSLATLTGDGN
ncbi:hypothetical protein [Roseimicrobium sp. ORNL1]|uniref:hypothetical protein n=1 Tax=Roseimicrobium sp. ORNL1 TaxID=2711231 RepID=UPI0013E1B2B5|nr:hypothetical protein [Roseimicrobium sp. ORNL1]QIF02128.1 hypothetical protein G5S37_11480 [Roseimicrobium sp. ORNL1]